MIIQTPSRIIKSDFRDWYIFPNYQTSTIIETKTLIAKELVIPNASSFEFESKAGKQYLFMPIFGCVDIDNQHIEVNNVWILETSEPRKLSVTNPLEDAPSDILIFEIKHHNDTERQVLSKIHFESNQLVPLSQELDFPNFIGIFDAREEHEYPLKKAKGSIFGLVINGAFEFQNRLLEVRDAIILEELDTLEIEALAPESIILFFEI